MGGRSRASGSRSTRGDARSLLAGEDVVHAYGPTNRNIPNLLRNLVLAARVLVRLRPRAILTTGAGVAVPFAWIGRLLGARVVYVESLTRIEAPSLSCRLIRPIARGVYVQWPELQEAAAGARYAGNVLDRRDLRHARDAGLPVRPDSARARRARGRRGARRPGRRFHVRAAGASCVEYIEPYDELVAYVRPARVVVATPASGRS